MPKEPEERSGRGGFLRKFVATAVLAFGAAVCFGIGWYVRDLSNFSEVPRSVPPAAPAVAAVTVTNSVFNPPEEFVGHVEPVQEVDILPQIEGYLLRVTFNEGTEVRKGELLFEIDPEQYRAAESQRRAEIAKAKGEVAVAEAEVDRTRRYLDRLKSADERGITQTDLDSAETGHAAAKAQLAAAHAAVSQAEANLALASVNIKHTKVYAPISGRIGKALRHAGDYVAPSKGALARIVQTDPVRVTFPVTDRAFLAWQAASAKRGSDIRFDRRIRLRLADDSLYGVQGAWEFNDNEMSRETATIQVRALFPNPRQTLLPNAFVTVLADETSPAPVLTVPAAAVVRNAKTVGVWTLDDGDVAHFTDVSVGASAGGVAVVESGLKPGTRVVALGAHKLGEGMKVRLVEAAAFK